MIRRLSVASDGRLDSLVVCSVPIAAGKADDYSIEIILPATGTIETEQSHGVIIVSLVSETAIALNSK